MKSYTDIEQSKKLAEIIPPESADMCWGVCDETLKWKTFPYLMPWRDYTAKEYYLPCWSLAALLEQFEDVIYDEDGHEYQLQIIKEGVQYYLVYDGVDVAAYYETPLFDDLVDACVDMILILKENDLIWATKNFIKTPLKRMKSLAKGEHPECFSEAQKAAEFIFPELKEKETEDERIRKAIIAYINHGQHNGVSNKDMIAWLEKQREQTHAKLGQSEVTKTSDQELSDKIEPKKLDADKVIEWLKNNGWCTVCGPKVERVQINKFKNDFGL